MDLYVATVGENVYAEAFKKMIELRDEGIRCEIDLEGKSLKAQMRQANRKGARFAAIFGEDELKHGEVVLRDMNTAEQKNVKLAELGRELSKG